MVLMSLSDDDKLSKKEGSRDSGKVGCVWDCDRLKAFIVQEKATGAAVLFLSFRFR